MIEQSFKDSGQILEQIEKGIPLIDVLCQGSGNYFEILKNLSTILPLKDAIACATDIDKNSFQRLLHFLSQMAYPAFLFFFSYFLVSFFESSILPGMVKFTQDEGSFLLGWIHLFLNLILISLCLLVFMSILFFFVPKFRQWTSDHILQRSSFFLKWMTNQFSHLFQACLQHGIATEQCLNTLENIKTNFWIHNIVLSLHIELDKGTSVQQAMSKIRVDPDFIRYFTIGTHSTSLSMMLDLYNKKCQKEIEKEIKKVSLFFQGISYFSVGMVVLTVYQVMLMPLEILNTV